MKKIKFFILLVILIFFSINIIFFVNSKKSDFIMDSTSDGSGNIYTMSYDEEEIYLKKINNSEILWVSNFDRNGEDYINVPKYLSVTQDGQLLVYIYQFDLNTYKKKSEKIYLYSKDGKKRKIIFNDELDIGIENTIFGINCYENNLYFFQLSPKSNDKQQIIDIRNIDLNLVNEKGIQEPQTIKTINYSSNIGINKYIYTKSNDVVYTTYSSEIYKISSNDNTKKIYPKNKDNNGIYGVSYDSEDNIYFQNVTNNKLMSINVNSEEINELYDNNTLKGNGLEYKNLKNIKFQSKNKFYGIQSTEIKNHNMISIYDNNKLINWDKLKYSYKIIITKILFNLLLSIGISILIFIMVIIIKRNNGGKLTIILKQTFIFIPVIIISVLIIFFLENSKFTEVINKQLIEQIYTISENKNKNINANKLKNINWNYPYDNPYYNELTETLELYRSDDKIYNYVENKNIDDPHNSIYSLLYIVKENKIYTGICDLNYVNIPIDYIYAKYDLKAYEKAISNKTCVYTELKDSNGDWLAIISPILDENGEVVALTEIGVTKQGFVNNIISNNVKQIATINIIIGISMIFVLIIVLYYLLIPLKKLKQGVTQLMKGNLGIQVDITSNDEVAEISKVFNKMSFNLKNDMDKLTRLNNAYYRFVPLKMFEILNKKDVLDINIGDQVKTNISLLFLTANNFKNICAEMKTDDIFIFINKMFNEIVPIISKSGGIVERYNNAGLISLFPQTSINSINSAIKIREAVRVNGGMDLNKIDTGFVINKEDIMIGIIGCEERVAASVISDYLTTLEGLNEFREKYGTNILVTEACYEEIENFNKSYNYRVLGCIKYKNKIMKLYDFFDGDDYENLELKKQTKNIFEQGVKLYCEKDFYNARRIFIEVLKQFKEDKASKEYLRLCDKYYRLKNSANIEIYLELF